MDVSDNPNKQARQRQPDGSTRQLILTLLKTKGASNAGDLAKSLGITEMAVRRHLGTLERDGFVRPTLVRQPMGRPSHVYGLTEQADGLFPKNYNVLVLDLLQEMESDPQLQDVIGQLFEGRKRKLLQKYASRMDGKTLEQRIDELACIQNEGGYMVELQANEADAYLLHEYNCPISQVANRYQQACQCEQDLFEQLLGVPVERTKCLAKGDGKCTYRIAK